MPSLTSCDAEAVGLAACVVDGRIFFDRLAESDSIAAETLDSYCGSLANYVFNIQTVLDVEAIAIGGGISAQPAFVNKLREKVEESFAQATAQLPRPDIRTCQHFNDANLVGALLHHRA